MSRHHHYLPLGSLVCLSMLLVCVGCGNNEWRHVSGTVTYNGQPIPGGSIVFEPFDGNGPTAGGKIQDGQYELPRVMLGKKTVRIQGYRKTGKKHPPDSFSGKVIDEVEYYIPAGYHKNSTLSCEITARGQDTFDFDLPSR